MVLGISGEVVKSRFSDKARSEKQDFPISSVSPYSEKLYFSAPIFDPFKSNAIREDKVIAASDFGTKFPELRQP
jgi:hypothetical protein